MKIVLGLYGSANLLPASVLGVKVMIVLPFRITLPTTSLAWLTGRTGMDESCTSPMAARPLKATLKMLLLNGSTVTSVGDRTGTKVANSACSADKILAAVVSAAP